VRAPFLDHIVVMVRDLAASQAFYEAALAPFGAQVVDYGEIGIGVGPEGSEDLGLREGEPRAPMHIAFLAADPATVDAFHAAALGAGGTDNGAPGRRPQYHERYYAAFVLDPDGNNVEAVCHTGPTESESSGPGAGPGA
jgi:catechol 2,3-dioxygenase-like lactoylglutathione lyase family enzyme